MAPLLLLGVESTSGSTSGKQVSSSQEAAVARRSAAKTGPFNLLPGHEFLDADGGFARKLTHHESRVAVGRVALVVVGLDDGALVQLGRVRALPAWCAKWLGGGKMGPPRSRESVSRPGAFT